jgi:hypothetical protein
MSLIIPANSASAAGGYEVDNSLRFNSGSSDCLNKPDNGTPTSAQIFTISCWVKRSTLGNTETLISFQTSDDGDPRFSLGFISDKLWVDATNSATTTVIDLRTTQVFRDTSAWYHIVLRFDTTQATDTNRHRVYVNGSQVTSFSSTTYLTQNEVVAVGFPEINIGTVDDNSRTNFFDGYLAEFVYCDGQTLDPTSFGEFDSATGIWKPIDVSELTFGTNGFYLDFEDSAALGDDVSGNGNDFTVNNLTAIDQTTDTPTNNFCTLNALIGVGGDSGNKQVLSEGNLKVTGNQASWCHSRGTMSYSVGKWYWEAKITGKIADMNIGVSNTGTNLFFGTAQSQSGNTTIYTEGDKNINGTITYGVFTTYSLGDIIGIAHNADANTVTFYKNGSAILSDQSVSGGNDTTWTPASAAYNTTGFFSFNFGSPIYSANSYTDGAGYGNFSYAVPSGYYALNTKNLAEYG